MQNYNMCMALTVIVIGTFYSINTNKLLSLIHHPKKRQRDYHIHTSLVK